MLQPRVLQPDPDPAFVRELRKIDPDLRVRFGHERYFLNRWVIERRIPPERYFASYASILESDEHRTVEQPIYDTNQPIYAETLDVDGNPILMGYTQVGTRIFDLAPEWEWVMTLEEDDRSFRRLDQRTLTELRRVYAWERGHSLTRLKMEKEAAREAFEKQQAQHRADENFDAIMEHKRELKNLPFSGQPASVMEGTAL